MRRSWLLGRQAGFVYLALFLGSGVAAWPLWRHFGPGVEPLVSLLLAVPTAYLAWLTLWRGERLPVAEIADRLAAEVGNRWRGEAKLYQLDDPLPVRWRAAPADLVTDWSSLVRMARTGMGKRRGTSDEWAVGAAGLSSEGDEPVPVLDRVPTGRMVILGEPGAGKTVMAIRMVLDLLNRRSSGGAGSAAGVAVLLEPGEARPPRLAGRAADHRLRRADPGRAERQRS